MADPAPASPARAKQTLCTFCGVVDQVTVTEDRKVRATGSLGVCVKGAHYFQKHLGAHPQKVARFTSPMLRSPYGWERVSWDYAIDMVADSILADRQDFGRDSLAFYGVGQMTMEALWVTKKFFQGHLGTNNICSNAEQCLANNAGGHELVFGNEGPFSCYDDYRSAEAIFFYGHNPAVNHPTVFQRYIRRNRDAVKVVVDPRRTDTVTQLLADNPDNIHLPVRSGSDVLLNLMFARRLLDTGAWNPSYVERHVDADSAESFLAFLRRGPFSVEEVVPRITPEGMDPADMRARVERACDLWARRRVVSTSSVGINQTVGSAGVASILNLHLLTGAIGEPGRGHVRLAGQSNASSELALGFSGRMLPFRMRVDNPEHRAVMADAWDLPPWRISPRPGLPVASFATSERLRTLFVFGTNPARNFPNLRRWREKMMDLCIVYADSYYNPEILEYADIILPCRTKHETSGIFLNGERRLQYMEPVEEPPFEAWGDVRIICSVARRIAERLGDQQPPATDVEPSQENLESWVAEGNRDLSGPALDAAFRYPAEPDGEPSGEAVWQEIQQASRGFYNEFTDADGKPITWDGIRSGEGVQWQGARRYVPPPTDGKDAADDEVPLFSGVFSADRRRARFHLPAPERLVPFQERGRGFVLITGRGAMGAGNAVRRHNTAMFNSSTATGVEDWPERNHVYVNPADAGRLGLAPGAEAVLRNELGEITCPVAISQDVPAGHVYLTFHPDRAGTHPNILTSSDNIDPHTWQPLLKDTYVDVVPVRAATPATTTEAER
ncbi:molybdopterin oxidoreductase family protein [Streptomyces tailanensis]|uniref:molybdopterin oxidoreductase family protein n=1 Tax=Streptomyces tailanensis TaxID=2569858 RepID=UPI00122E0911|nr:molybdopterin-dependent oxidoreductase [Streptomyces tailanensis]